VKHSLVRGQDYQFRVTASNLVGEGAQSDTITLTASQAPGVALNIIRTSFDSEP